MLRLFAATVRPTEACQQSKTHRRNQTLTTMLPKTDLK